MRRSATLVILAAVLVSGCAATPTARLATSAVAGKPPAPAAAPAMTVQGPVPTVVVRPGAAVVPVAAPVAAVSRAAAAEVVALDAELEALELLADEGAAYQLQGFFGDLKDSIKRVWQRWQLSREVKLALRHKREKAFELHEGEIDNQRKHRSAPITEVKTLEGGGKEIVTTWNSTLKGTFTIETRRTLDAEGTTQVLAVRKAGLTNKDLRVDLVRVRTLEGADGAYKVVTQETTIFPDGRQQYAEWTKTVRANGAEEIDGFITHRDGHRTEITGTRDTDGKVHVEVSKIAPSHNPSPMPSASPIPDEDEPATPSVSPSPSVTPSAEPSATPTVDPSATPTADPTPAEDPAASAAAVGEL
ncbi:MAG: hypothetical protein VKQ33_10700 [Candidatus Sericytochromatia bacterium]|nr:hypothetical protein [Candidatus Sericytochromatia bacterium]